MGVASYLSVVKKSGTATAMTSQAMSTNSTVANTFQVGSTARRIWDRLTTPTFRDGGSTIAASDVTSIDYLFGKVTFATTKASVTVSGNYLPVTNIAGANSYTLNQSRDIPDNTDFSSTGWRYRTCPALWDVNVAMTRFSKIGSTNPELDFVSAINTGTPLVVEIRPGGGSNITARGFFVVESENQSGDVASLETADLSFQLDGNADAAFSWGTP